MKRMRAVLAGMLLLFISTMQVWAQDIAPTFSSVEYLSEDAAAVKVAQMMKVSKQDAVNQIKAAQAKVPVKSGGLLSTQGKKRFFAHVAKLSGGELIETDAVTYHAAWNQDTQVNALADCLLKIDAVSIAGDKLYFGMDGYTGFGAVYGFSSAEMKRNAKGVWEMVNPDQVDIKVS